MEQTSAKSQLPSFFSLLKESFQVYKSKWKILFILSIIPFAFNALIGAATALIIAPPVRFLWIAVACFFVLSISYFIISAWLQTGTVMVLRNRTEALDIRQILRLAKPFIFPYIWVTLITLPIIILGFIFFAIPGIIFSTWFLFAQFVLIVENQKGIDAIAKSREYIRGYFGKILLLVLIAGFLMFLIMSIFESISKNLPMGNYIYSTILILIAPLPVIYYYLIYEHIKKIKNGAVAIPSAKQKNFFVALAAIGTVAIMVIAGLLIYFAPQIKNYYEIEMKDYEAQTGNQLPPLPI
jgi:hypothetical protein